MSRCRANSSPSASSLTTTCSSSSSSGGRTAQRLPASDRPHRDRGGRGEQARHRPLGTGSRRGAHPRSRTARRRLLELLARQSVVGNDPLRTPPVQPERASGRRGLRRPGASGAVRPRPRRRQLARHRGAQQRRDDPALRAHRDGADTRVPGWCRSMTSRRHCPPTPRGSRRTSGHRSSSDAGAPSTGGSHDDLLRRRTRGRCPRRDRAATTSARPTTERGSSAQWMR